jgi:hypothetical protein
MALGAVIPLTASDFSADTYGHSMHHKDDGESLSHAQMLYGGWQDLHSLTYLCTCSVLVSSLPITSYLKNYK